MGHRRGGLVRRREGPAQVGATALAAEALIGYRTLVDQTLDEISAALAASLDIDAIARIAGL
jgi:hypothetical protein